MSARLKTNALKLSTAVPSCLLAAWREVSCCVAVWGAPKEGPGGVEGAPEGSCDAATALIGAIAVALIISRAGRS